VLAFFPMICSGSSNNEDSSTVGDAGNAAGESFQLFSK
jgi:hypothetical protein